LQERVSPVEALKISIVLRAARTALGISQADLAAGLGVSQSTIARCERGAGTIPANTMLKAISFFKSHHVDISGILEKNPVIRFEEALFVETAEADRERQRELMRSGMRKRFGVDSDDL